MAAEDEVEVEIANPQTMSREDAQNVYSASLRPESKSLRDGYLQSFSQYYKIGRLFSSSGGILYEGKTATEWMQTFKLLPGNKQALSPEEIRGYLLKLAQLYHTASSFHANLFVAAEKLEAVINEKESGFITDEVGKYRRGGEYWDETTNKLRERRPAKEAFERMAETYTVELRKAHKDLRMEVSFFQHILADLEAQRRCLKDYGELSLAEMRASGTFRDFNG